MNSASLEQTYQRYFPIIRERCRKLLGDSEEANDVAQETFIRFWRSNEAHGEPRQAAAWLHRTSVHLAIDFLRRRRRHRASIDSGELEMLEHSPMEILQNRRSLELLVQHLPAELLEAAILTRVDGLSQLEVAELMGCSERTVRRLLEKLEVRLSHLRREFLS